ncbi:MAG: exopolyphosphatase [Thermodesulfobacteriota bacterium]|nr:exopolyphosphatase [Thermodesulfobacteriota bacterium]
MYAVIDIGSNTLRMLLGDVRDNTILPHQYEREITRLAGNFSVQIGLGEAALERTLTALESFKKIISEHDVDQVRVVATAALRSANNRQVFLDRALTATNLKIEVIGGEEEALLTTLGVLSVIDPLPESVILIDIGGGSTELICVVNGKILLQKSYPLGVVRLCEDCFSIGERQQQIDTIILKFVESLKLHDLFDREYQLIGAAGTITTLAALYLKLKKYNSALINNCELSVDWLEKLQAELELISSSERENLIGMEKGRGDLILPGLQVVLTLMKQFQFPTIRVSDSGLLEGVMLRLTGS